MYPSNLCPPSQLHEHCIRLAMDGRGALADISADYGGVVTASMAKYWVTDTRQEVLDECVQLKS
jgi:alkylation response protein AidB-like acyl-CoA dehydrogenase